jgi:hypothetical protein
MIDMGMSLQHEIDALWIERERRVVQLLERLVSLEQSTIDKKLAVLSLHEEARPGHRAGRAAEPDRDHQD